MSDDDARNAAESSSSDALEKQVEKEGEKESSDDSDDDNSTASIEPDYDKANSLSFYMICSRMETLWKTKQGKKRIPEAEKKKYILPPPLLKEMESQSVFPWFRLLMPDIDGARSTNVKEKKIAQAYCDAEGFAKGTKNYEMLYGFTDPQKVPSNTAGDLSLVVEHVMEKRIPKKKSDVTVGQINHLLDELVSLRLRKRHHNHAWRENFSGNKKSKKTETALRERWLRKVISKGLSPLEHKWLVRILLKKMEFGMGTKALLTFFNPYAMELWNAHNSLKNLCDKLADPDYTTQRIEQEKFQHAMQEGAASRWEAQAQPAVLGNTISPMLAEKSQFATLLNKVHHNHTEYLKTTSKPPYLALKFPTICAEIKLDGERMVVHFSEGKVTMHTRNSKWYSQLYSPVIGTALRKALSKYNINVILDGEMTSWDNGRQELIPFGSNRTVAKFKRNYLYRHGLLDDRDKNLHTESTDSSIMRAADENKFIKGGTVTAEDGDPGKECWLQYQVFDILYVDGPGSKNLLRDCGLDDVKPGSIINLTGLQRKQILYRCLEEQPNEIEIGKSLVIRSNGECVSGEKYFSTVEPKMELGHLATVLDSTQAAIEGRISEDLDCQRRNGKSMKDISRMRAQALDGFYRKVVELHKMEGLVVKDLAAPYILGSASRSRKYWHKFKPDYEKKDAVDIDVVILGAYFATGLRHSGQLSSFLCGCVDSDDPSAFMTLCNVNGKSVKYEKLDMIMKVTGFERATEEEDTKLGKWFREDDHGKSLPSFISSRSFQRGREDFDGWKFSRNKNYPDLWIHPEDSVVLKIYGQELVQSDDYSAGISLRFARVDQIRHEAIDGDEKPVSEIDSEHDLWQIYTETRRQRQESAALANASTFSPTKADQPLTQSVTRFLTPEEYAQKSRKRKRKSVVSPSKIPKVETLETNVLEGLRFSVLEGNYSLDANSLEAQEAQDQGWLDRALRVKRKEHVMEFILRHAGKILVSAESSDTYILGGDTKDARVVNFIRGIKNARSQSTSNPKTKQAVKMKKLAENDGVLKWTFVYSLVHRLISNQSSERKRGNLDDTEKRGDITSINKTDQRILKPKLHHYLARVNTEEGPGKEIFNLENSSTTKMDLIRALQEGFGYEADASTAPQCQYLPWQYRGHVDLELQDRWVLSYRLGKTCGEDRGIVLYPDIFVGGFGISDEEEAIKEVLCGSKSERWEHGVDESFDQILSSLPLSRAMGALVTPHLHSGVTHIVCGLKDSHQILVYNDNLAGDVFKDPTRGGGLIEHLTTIRAKTEPVLVSPEWIRTLWEEGTGA